MNNNPFGNKRLNMSENLGRLTGLIDPCLPVDSCLITTANFYFDYNNSLAIITINYDGNSLPRHELEALFEEYFSIDYVDYSDEFATICIDISTVIH